MKTKVMTTAEFNARAELAENKILVQAVYEKAIRELERINNMRRRDNLPEETFVVMTIPYRALSFDVYQRDVNYNKINDMIVNYNPNKVDIKSLVFRDGKLMVDDGQHLTLTRNAIGYTDGLFKVHPYINTLEDASAMFSDQHNGVTRLSGIDKYKADLYAKRAYALAIKEVCDARKITLRYVGGISKRPSLMRNNINAIKPLIAAYKLCGKSGIEVILDIIIDAGWRDNFDCAFKSDCLVIGKTLCEIAHKNNTIAKVGDDNYNKVLDTMKIFNNPDDWIGIAHHEYSGNRGQHGEGSIRDYVRFICGEMK